MSILIKVPSVNDNTAVDANVNGTVCGRNPSLAAMKSPNCFSGSKSTRIVLTGNAMENPLKKMDQFTVPMATRGKTILSAMLMIREIQKFSIRLNLLNIFFINTFQSTYTQRTEDLYRAIGYKIHNLTNTQASVDCTAPGESRKNNY